MTPPPVIMSLGCNLRFRGCMVREEPVIVHIDRVFILGYPASDGRSLTPEEREKKFESKLQQIEEAESATLDAISKSKLGNLATGNSWLGSLIGTIIGNLKISIRNVHVRYEDSIRYAGEGYARSGNPEYSHRSSYGTENMLKGVGFM